MQFRSMWVVILGMSLSAHELRKPYLHSSFEKTWGSVQTISATNQKILSALNDQTNLGDLVTVERQDYMTISFEYGVQEYDVGMHTEGSGTISSESSMAILCSGEKKGSQAFIETKRRLPHVPGHDSYLFFTAKFSKPLETSIQWIGMFDDGDGVALGYNGTDFSVLIRSNGVDLITSQTEFNIDKLDGLEKSRLNIVPSNLNLFRILLGSSKVSPIRYQVLDDDGTWITFHVVNKANQVEHPLFINSFLPLRAEVKKEGVGADISLATSSWSAGFVGKLTSEKRFFSKASQGVTLDKNNETHVLTLQNKDIFNKRPNKIEVRLTMISGGSVSTGNEVSLLRVRKNATLDKMKFNEVSPYSVMEFSDAGYYKDQTGIELLNFPNGSRGQGSVTLLLPREEMTILLQPNESITITGQSLSGSGNVIFATVGWEEQIY